MILGLGIDVVELARIRASLERFSARFLEKILTPEELRELPAVHPVPFVAARFAAKEAAVKALGTGFARGITPQHAGVRKLPSGRPELLLYGPAAEEAAALGVRRIHLSLTHGRDTAAAVVVLETLS